MKTARARVLVLVLLAATAYPARAAGAGAVPADVEAALGRLAPGEKLTVVVHMVDRADLSRFAGRDRKERVRAIIGALRSRAELSQRAVLARLDVHRAQDRVARVAPLWIVNGLAVTATADVIRELAARPGVRSVELDAVDVRPSASPPTGPPEANVAATGAPDLWSLGHLGEGIVVATLDSGANASHPDLAGRWRGGTGGWFDPYGQHATPHDPTGHGTWTLGVIVGGDAGGTAIGVAPGATWIAARIWNDSGAASASAIHQAFQWLLDPDGDPATDDAPEVVNGSWAFGSPGCNLEFQPDLQALRAAGILPVFAAGNFGPGTGTSVSPANYPEALSVGATGDTGVIAYDSSRGPSACGGAVYPDLVAPGLNVTTTDLYSFYASVSGTSIAAPHVAGSAALLLGAFPGTSSATVEAVLQQTAIDKGPAGPDNVYGNGWVSVKRAFDALVAAPPPPPPTASDDSFALDQDTSATVAAPGVLGNDSDPSGLSITAVLASGPSSGTLTLRPDGGFTYTPAMGFSGQDAFAYQASNGQAASAPALVSLTVRPAQPPVAGSDAYSTSEDVPLAVAAPGVLSNDASPAGKVLTAVLVSSPAHGTVSLQPTGAFTYTPATNYAGADSFTYQARDGLLASPATSVTLAISAVNDRPVAADDVATTARGTAVTIPVLANDLDVDGTLAVGTVAIAAAPKNGSASRKSNGTIVYTPSRRFTGIESFQYTVKDSAGATSNVATVRVTVR